MKILITGGAGYIGSHVVHDLIEQGHDTFVFDNLSTGLEQNLHPSSKFIEGDILNENDLNKIFEEKYDVIFHFAALKAAGDSMIHPSKFAKGNITGSLNLLMKMVQHDVKHIIFSSSAAVYGNPQYLPIDEDHPKDPTNYYGYTKLAIEENLEWFSRLHKINYAALRYFNATGYDVRGRVYGQEKDTTNLSPLVMEVAAGTRKELQVFGDDYDTEDGTCIRDYIHVNDLSDAHLRAMDYLSNENKNLVVNLGTNKGSSVLEVIKAAEKAIDKTINYKVVGRRAGDPANLVASYQRAKEILNWEAKYSDLNTIFESMKKVYLK
ncbi:MAG: UDP-glucose 4-epimerase GalE [Melioribacteraceae bacterium]|nr:MAG: UDP-glucose 4-epimerase GalE [Melioribacteraceae bacterium]